MYCDPDRLLYRALGLQEKVGIGNLRSELTVVMQCALCEVFGVFGVMLIVAYHETYAAVLDCGTHTHIIIVLHVFPFLLIVCSFPSITGIDKKKRFIPVDAMVSAVIF